VCLNNIRSGGCTSDGAGGHLCEASAAAPPAPSQPDNEYVPATPDRQIATQTGTQAGASPPGSTTINHYGSGTTAAAANAGNSQVGGTGTGDSSGQDTDDDGLADSGVSSVTGGADCSSPPVCTGYAVQCSTLLQTYRTRCALTEVPTSGQLQDATGLDPWTEETELLPQTDVDLSTLSYQRFLSGACINDIEIWVMATPVTIPLSGFCNLFIWGGYLVVVTALYGAGRIIIGGLN